MSEPNADALRLARTKFGLDFQHHLFHLNRLLKEQNCHEIQAITLHPTGYDILKDALPYDQMYSRMDAGVLRMSIQGVEILNGKVMEEPL